MARPRSEAQRDSVRSAAAMRSTHREMRRSAAVQAARYRAARRAAMRAAAVKCRTAAVDGGYAMVAVWKSDLVGSDIDPLHGVFEERAANRGWGPWFLRNLALRRHHPICPGEHFPGHRKRTGKPDQRHRQGKREIMGLVAVGVTVSQDRI